MIRIANKLEIQKGGWIKVPGCEPTSAITSPVLSASMSEDCTSVLVRLEDAVAAIPGSTVETTYNPKVQYFVLPYGPPPQHGCNYELCADWYAVLRGLGVPEEGKQADCGNKPTDGFGYFSGVFSG